MPLPRRSIVFGLAAAGLVVAVVATALVRRSGFGSVADSPGTADSQGAPKVVVDRTPWELGEIESPEEFQHTFVLRNEGDAPLTLVAGASTCSCTVTDLPTAPVPPGGEARVRIGFKESAMKDTLKAGQLSRGVWVHTNDPHQEKFLLGIDATVVRRLAMEPAAVVFSVNAVGSLTERERTGSVLVYSQTWDRFYLAVSKPSSEGLKWRVKPAAKERLVSLEARSGYQVEVVLPPDVPDGDFSARLDLRAAPAGDKEKPRSLPLPVRARVEGRLTISGRNVDAAGILRLGVISPGQSVQETLLLKVNDDRRLLNVNQVETKPDFLRARVVPFKSGLEQVGLYRVEVEIRDASPGTFGGDPAGLIRLKTDHPRLKAIEVKVDFSVVRG